MKTYTIRDPQTKEAVQFTLCEAHVVSGLDGSAHVIARPAAKDELCEVCRQDRIRAAIRSIGSVVA